MCDYVDSDIYCAMLIATRVKPSILIASRMCGEIDYDTIVTAANWLQEAANEKFNPADIMDGLAEDLEG